MGSKTCGFERSVKPVRSVMSGALASVLVLLAFVMCMPQLAFADDVYQTIDGTMTITLQGGASGGGAGGGAGASTAVTTSTTTSGGTSSGALTGDVLIWLILGIVVLLVGAVYVIVKSRRLANAGIVTDTSATGISSDAMIDTPAGMSVENVASDMLKTIIVTIVAVFIACACFGMFASKSNAFAKEYLEGITGTSNVVVDEQGNVLSNDLAINNGSGVAIYINNIQAPDELNGWNASIKDETVQSGSSAKGTWDGKTIPASVLEQVKSNSNTSIELALKISINKAFDFDKFSVDTDSVAYDGNQIKPEVTSDVYKQGTDFEVIYGENKNAGEGTITIKGIGDYQGEKTCTFTIEQKELTLSWGSETTFTYNGKSHAPSAEIADVLQGDTVNLTVEGKQINASDAPYTATATIDNANYKLPDNPTQSFTINQREVTLNWSKDTFIYNKSEQAPTATAGNLVGTDKVAVMVDGAKTDVGTYTATATALDNTNYKLPAEATYSFTINQKELTLSWGEQTIFTYDRELHAPSVEVAGVLQGDTVNLTVEGKQTNASDAPYTATATIDNANYKLPADNTKNFTIARAEIVVSGITAKDKIYDGTTKVEFDYSKAILTGKVGGDDLTVTAEGAFEYVSAGTNKEVTITKLTLGGNSAGNYKLARDGQQTTTTATIEQVKLDFTKIAIDTKNATYTGEQIKPSITSDDYTEYVDYEVIYGKNINAGENAGSVTIKGIGNYTGEDTTTFTIAKANPNPTTPELTAETGQTLADVVLPKQTEPVPGTFAWEAEDPSAVSVGEAGTTPTFNAIFTPNDTNNYNTQVVTVPITVTNAKTAFAVLFADNTLGFYNRVDIPKENEGFDEKTISAVYTGIENANYQPEWLDKAITSATVVDAGVQPKSTANWFALTDTSKLTTVDVSKLETKNTTDMSSMFKGCSALTTVGDISSWNTAQVTNMASMFEGCTTLEQVGDISQWNTAQVTNMTSMFKDCAKLKEDCSDWNVDKVGSNHADFDANAPGIQSPWDEDLDFSKFTVDTKVQTYCASQITPSVTSIDYTKDADYEVIYGANLRAGDGTITIKGLNKHQGEKTYTFAIHQKELGLTWNETSFTYDGKSHLPTITLEGVIEGDTVNSIVKGTEGVNAGSYPAIAYIDNTNYMLSENYKTMFTINKAKVRISGITANNKTYDGTIKAELNFANVKFEGKLDSDELSVTAEGAFENANVGAFKTVDISHIVLSGTSAKNYKLDERGQQVYSAADIDQLVAEIEWNQTSLTYTASPRLPKASVKNAIQGDWVGVSVVTKDGTDAIKVGTYEAIPEGLSNPNYTLPQDIQVQQFTIEKAPLTVGGSIRAYAKDYDRTDDARINLSQAEITGILGKDEVKVEAKGTFEDANAGANKTVAITYSTSGKDAENYEANTTTSIMSTTGIIYSASIDPNKIVISSEGTSYTGEQVTPQVSYEGLVQNEDFVVAYGENINAGEKAGSVIVKGINSCTGQETVTFEIKKATPEYTIPQNISAEVGSNLAQVTLPKQTTPVKGMFVWSDPSANVGAEGSHVFSAKFIPEDTDNYKTVENIEIPVEVTKEKTAFAVYFAEDSSLNFYNRVDVPKVGDTFDNKTVSAVYDKIETENYRDSGAPWNDKTIKTVKVIDQGIQPASTARWFEAVNKVDLTTADVSKLDISKTTDMMGMFYACTEVTSVGDISQWDTSSVANMHYMFYDCNKLSLDCSNWNVDKVGEAHQGFNEHADGVISPWDTKTAFAVYSETGDDNSLNFYKRVKVPEVGDTFDGKTVTAVYSDIENSTYTYGEEVTWYKYRDYINSVKVVDEGIAPVSTAFWFSHCEYLTSVDVSKLDTSKTTLMAGMFEGCLKLTSLDVSSFNTSKVTNMLGVFIGCISLESIQGLQNWDTSNVTDMRGMFNYDEVLQSATVSNFNTSKVENMGSMFYGCSSLTSLDLSNWNISSVKNLSSMFKDCNSLISIGGLSGWNTSNVTDMSSTFQNCSILTADCSDWSIDNVPNDKHSSFNENAPDVISPWSVKTAFAVYSVDDHSLNFYKGKTIPKEGDTFNGKTVTALFTGIENSSGLAPWDIYEDDIKTVSVIDSGIKPVSTAYWFYNCYKLTSVDISKLDTSSTTTMSCMFYNCENLTKIEGLSGWNTAKVESMSQMFRDCFSLVSIGDISKWDTAKVKNMSLMFSYSSSLVSIGDISKWDTGKVTDMSCMFEGCSSLASVGDISQWNTANVVSMRGMFVYCYVLGSLGDISSWNTSKVADMATMFYNCKSLSADCSKWNVEQVGDRHYAFGWHAPYVKTPWDQKSIFAVYSDTDNSLSFYNDFSDKMPKLGDIYRNKSVTALYTGIESNTYSQAGDVPWNSYMNDIKIVSVVDSGIAPVSTAYWFNNCLNLTSADVSNLDTSNIQSMSCMFNGCSSLTTVGDISLWDTGKVTDMLSMFNGCSSLTTVGDVFSWDTSRVADMENMFCNCSRLSADCSSWNVRQVGDRHSGFVANAPGVKSPWDTTFVVYSASDNSLSFYKGNTVPKAGDTYKDKLATAVYTGIESDTYNPGTVPWNSYIKDIKTVSVVDSGIAPVSTAYWFNNCLNLTSADVSKLDTSNIQNMSCMFRECSSLVAVGDISQWDTSKVADMLSMFSGCSSLTSISDISPWDTSRVADMSKMFNGCSSLATVGNISSWNTNKVIDMKNMFCNCSKLSVDCSSWNIEQVGDSHSDFNTNAASVKSPWDTQIAFAVYSANDNSLNFYKDYGYRIGDTYRDKPVTAVYKGIEDGIYGSSSEVPWNSYLNNIKTVSVVDEGITPVSTAHWFNSYSNLISADVSKLDTSNTQNMSCMFRKCSSLVTAGDISQWDTSKVTDMNNMFYNCQKLSADCSNWNVEQVGDNHGFNTNASSVKAPWNAAFAVYSASDNSLSFYKGNTVPKAGDTYKDKLATAVYTGIESDNYDRGLYDRDVPWKSCKGEIKTVSVVDSGIMPVSTAWWFHNCPNLTSADVSKLDTSNIQSMYFMFSGCPSLTTVGDVSSWDTGRVTNMENMFRRCSKLSVDCSGWNVEQVGRHYGYFSYKAPGVKSPWDTKKVFAVYSWTDKSLNFYNDYIYKIPKSGDTYRDILVTEVYTGIESNIYSSTSAVPWLGYANDIKTVSVADSGITPVSTAYWFDNCSSLTTADVSKLDTSNTQNMSCMFNGCSSLTTVGDISQWNTSKATDMTSMFCNCSSLSADCSGWNVDNVGDNHKDFNTDAPGVKPPWGHISKAVVTIDTGTRASIYDGTTYVVSVTKVTLNGEELDSSEWEVNTEKSTLKATDAGTYTVYVTGKGDHWGEAIGTWTIARRPVDIDSWNLKLSNEAYWYDGTPKTPKVIGIPSYVYTKDEDYTITYIHNVKPGIAKVRVEFIGNYTGSKELKFRIDYLEPS